ncbi:MAG: RNA methyltransferase [Flavobacteriales bacterium]|nr:MAG: RNA methyltransferase [Flavobacteriales bacterium]
MLSKNEIKLITRLQQKKYRLRTGFFIVEGVKNVNECINAGMTIQNIYATDNYKAPEGSTPVQRLSDSDLHKISALTTPNEVLAIVEIPERQPIEDNGLIVALDGVRDPGNLGTIIRLCDWFGVKSLVCSQDSVDCYNPKVVQATMGSIARVDIYYSDLEHFLSQTTLPLFFTTIQGDNLYKVPKPENAVIVMGSESHGIRQPLLNIRHQAITIPRRGDSTIESLNVATAAAITINEFCKF